MKVNYHYAKYFRDKRAKHMNIPTKIIILSVLALIIGASLVCVGLLFDPFSLPFQDYDQMPLETQQA